VSNKLKFDKHLIVSFQKQLYYIYYTVLRIEYRINNLEMLKQSQVKYSDNFAGDSLSISMSVVIFTRNVV